jgi:hypothetical protein
MQYDLTKPNTGRMVDYWLGGSHNFEIDRQFADQVSQKLPPVVEVARVARSMAKRGVQYFCARGIRAILDFGSALPTCENTHLVAHQIDPAIKVVYSDIDPITVAYGQDLLRGNPNVIYLQCDAATPDLLLNSPEAQKLLGNARRVGIVFLALAHIIPDDRLRVAWRTLYDWAAPGSCMIVSSASEHWKTDPNLIPITRLYDRADLPGQYRTATELAALAPPWQLTPEGVVDFWCWSTTPPSVPSPRALAYGMMVYKGE